MLPKDLMFEHLEHNNTGKNYQPSKMYEDFDLAVPNTQNSKIEEIGYTLW